MTSILSSAIIEFLIAFAAAVAALVWSLWKDFPSWATASKYELCFDAGTIPDQYREPWWKEKWIYVRLRVKYQEDKCKLCLRAWDCESDWSEGFCPDCVWRNRP